MTPPLPSPEPASGSWKWVALLVLSAIVGVIYVATWPAPPQGPAVAKVTPEQLRRLFELRNLTLGQIDNALGSSQLNQALEQLVEIEKLLPGDRFVLRNRAIIYVLALQVQDKPSVPKVSPDDVFSILDAVKPLDPKSPIPYVLAAHVAEKNALAERMLPEARRLVELAPADPRAWYTLAKVAEFVFDDPAIVQASREALWKAHELAPRNTHLLRLLARSLAEAKDPRVSEVLQQLKDERALIELVQRVQLSRESIDLQLETALAAVKAEDWDKALYLCQSIGNVISQQAWVKSDRQAIDSDQPALSYILRDFSTPLPLLENPQTVPAMIRFSPFSSLSALAPLGEVRDLQFADCNDDGTLDCVVLTANGLQALTRSQTGWSVLFERSSLGQFTQILVADLDRDENNNAKRPIGVGEQPRTDPRQCDTADVDFILAGPEGLLVLKNEWAADGTARQLVEVPQGEEFAAQRGVESACLVDFDHDGDLDLTVALETSVRFWRNRGDVTFEDVTSRSDVLPPGTRVVGWTMAPWNLDCFIDLLAATADGRLLLFENQGHSTFRWRELESEGLPAETVSRLTTIDADGDLGWDVAMAGPGGVSLLRSQVLDVGDVQILQARPISGQRAGRLLAGDFNNDSWVDLVTWSADGGGPVQLLFGGPEGAFGPSDLAGDEQGPFAPPPAQVRAVSAGDLDGDGDLDLAVATAAGVEFLENSGTAGRHWLSVRLRAQPEDKVARVNHLAIGSIAEVWMGSDVRRQVVNGQFTHFGLGEVRQPDLLRVVWTNCVPQSQLQPPSDLVLCDVQIQTTSCPYLFTWNGQRFEFLYDFLWGAPLGLQFAEGVLAPSRHWEYLHIPGDRLRGQEGRLVLQMTEELQEATYLDQVELLAIDHPADVEVFSNEKVGPPDLAAFQVHTVRHRRAPIAARDARGRDVLDEIALADGHHFRGHQSPPRTGRVESHYLELDLGDLGPCEEAKQIRLVLTGSIYPAATSVSVGLAQDPNNPPGSPPALWVPDAGGAWREVRPFAGFPGGKNKTIVLDLSDVFLTRDYRLRIATNLEICWDEAFFTLNDSPVEVRQTPLKLTRADLHYRGYSERKTSPFNAPDTYLYDSVDRSAAWLPMEGSFTRFGDVRPLLTEADDRLVVFGFGDELTLEFAEPAPPPAGWKRDYILHNVGWDKDSDPNVIHGDAVGPLPFRAMARYPYGPEESFPDTPAHREYLQTYQTRRQDRLAFWRRK